MKWVKAIALLPWLYLAGVTLWYAGAFFFHYDVPELTIYHHGCVWLYASMSAFDHIATVAKNLIDKKGK